MNSNAIPLPTPASALEADTPVRVADDVVAEPMQTRLLPVIQEVLTVEKRTVDRGGWRVTKRIRSHEETVDELLRDQTVSIERRPIGRTLDGATMPTQRYEGDVLVLPVVREVLVTEKRLVLVEEIRITQVSDSRRETQKATLRTEEISIERLGPETTPGPGLSSTADR